MRRITIFIVVTCLIGLLLASTGPAWGYDNNGWDTNSVYAPEIDRAIGASGRLYKVRESDGYTSQNAKPVGIDDYGPMCGQNSLYYSVTFAGSGCDDARLFVSKGENYQFSYWGTHDGGDNQAILNDSTKAWTVGSLVGKTVKNVTDGSSGTITANTATTVTAVLAGGTENDWDNGDEYGILCGTATCGGDGQGGNDILIAELDPACNRLNQTYLFANLLYGQARSKNIQNSNLRYSKVHNTLFLGVNTDISQASPATIYEVDLGLTTVLRTFTGPNVLDERVQITLNDADGTLYVIAQNLNSPRPFSDSGTHDGANDQAVLTDSTKAWTVNALVGMVLFNNTDGCRGNITANTATTITVDALVGGTENDWDGDQGGSGTHDGADDQAVLTDSTQAWVVDSLVGKILRNVTDGSQGNITANTETTITVDLLVGGTDNDWDSGDTYRIGTGDAYEIDDITYGDLIAFDTSGGSTSSYTTLIDSDGNSQPNWDEPIWIAYRGTYNPSGRPTILVSFRNIKTDPVTSEFILTEPTKEFYLDETDANGDLKLRGTPLSIANANNAQLDEDAGTVWVAAVAAGVAPAYRGIWYLKPNDTSGQFIGAGSWFKLRDAASPGRLLCPRPCYPIIKEMFNPDVAYAGIEYTPQMEAEIAEGCPASIWSLTSDAPGATIDMNTGAVGGWTPTYGDVGLSFNFEVTAFNLDGSDTMSWTVDVYPWRTPPFPTYWVYQVGHMFGIHYDEVGKTSTLWKRNGTLRNERWSMDNWFAITFAGTADYDVQCFVIRPDPTWFPGIPTDVIIAELDKDANVLNSAYLGVLAGVGQNNLGVNLMPHNIRYNAANDTLMIGVNPDDSGATSNAMFVYEVDLGLTTVVATYTGPNVAQRGVGLDVNPDDGTLYATNWDMGSTTPGSGKGDLIAFDTSGGSTSSYTVLIDGDTLGDADWVEPVSVVYRGTNNPSGRPTILVLMSQNLGENPSPQLEFYLDQTDGNGNLVKRTEQSLVLFVGRNGQRDDTTGAIWLVQEGRQGMMGLMHDDSVFHPNDLGDKWLDVGTSPGIPICNPIVFADVDKDGDVDQDDFAVFQVCFTGASGGIPAFPIECYCFNREGNDTDIDQDDFAKFEACATGPGIPWSQTLKPSCVP